MGVQRLMLQVRLRSLPKNGCNDRAARGVGTRPGPIPSAAPRREDSGGAGIAPDGPLWPELWPKNRWQRSRKFATPPAAP